MTNRGFALASLAFGAMILAGASTSRAAGPFQFHAVTPCRVLDTRVNGGQTTGAPQNQGQEYDYVLQGNCGIPVGAKAVTLNATLVSPTREGFLSLWPAGGAFPTVSTLNFNAGEPALANGAIVPVASPLVGGKDIAVAIGMQAAGTAHVIIDVTGYFIEP
jgi:hypothetical protein